MSFKADGWPQGQRVSQERSPWAIICPKHGQVFLTYEEYDRQLYAADRSWFCPHCSQDADWDDNNHDEYWGG